MRLLIPCMKCSAQGKTNVKLARVELQDNNLYLVTCPDGHQTATALMQPRFEVLAELAANAIIDGYYREAVASFTAAFERFLEFYIAITCARRGVSDDAFNSMWKAVRRQSERQLGAFLLLYLTETGEPPTLLSDNLVKFRNEVIHNGKIPSKDQATSYGQAVIDVVAPILGQLKGNDPATIVKVMFKQLQEASKFVPKNETMATMGMTMTISVNLGASQAPLAQSLARITMLRQDPTPIIDQGPIPT